MASRSAYSLVAIAFGSRRKCMVAADGMHIFGVKTADGLAVGFGQIVEDGVAVGVFLGGDRVRLEAEMHGRRGWDAHFRRDAGVGLEELEMLEHRMAAGE